MYRKFWLENALGKKFELTDLDYNHTLIEPSELGFTKQVEYITLGNIEKITTEKYDILDPKGTLLFYPNNTGNEQIYEDYNNYIKFIRYTPLKFYYLPPNASTPYYKEGIMIKTDKEEISKDDGALHCPFEFRATTHWRTSELSIVEVEPGGTGGSKAYPYNYSYNYPGSNFSDIKVTNNGSLPVGMNIEIDGAVTNPQFSIFDDTGIEYGSCKINGTYTYVRVNSVDSEQSIYLENEGVVIANPSSYQDISVSNGEHYVTFLKLKVGESKMNFSLGSSFSGKVKIQWRNADASV